MLSGTFIVKLILSITNEHMQGKSPWATFAFSVYMEKSYLAKLGYLVLYNFASFARAVWTEQVFVSPGPGNS